MDIGNILSTIPPIVENIFTHLNGEELTSCATVCELWKRIAETEKSRRQDIVWFFQSLKCSIHDQIHSSRRECSLDDNGTLEEGINMQLQNLPMDPYFCFAFATNNFLLEFQDLFPSFNFPPLTQAKRRREDDFIFKRTYLKAAIHTSLGQYIPDACKISFLITPGIVGTQTDGKPLEIEDSCAIAGVMIPHVPGLQMYHFVVDERHCDIARLIPTMRVKCLLLFHAASGDSASFNKIVQNCLLKENSQVAIGGALIERSDAGRSLAVAFCGRSVEAASVIIKREDREAEVENKLRLFQETGLLENRCFAFMFSCVARGYFIYGDYNLESSIFHRLYPNIPIQGVFGNGEIGVNYLPNVSYDNQNEILRIGKLARSRKKFLHSYTTIFVLISIKV